MIAMTVCTHGMPKSECWTCQPTPATVQQPKPITSTGDVWLSVIRDMEERREFGIAKYGTPLQVGNGRNALVDAYQEALDLCVYLKQAIEGCNANLQAKP